MAPSEQNSDRNKPSPQRKRRDLTELESRRLIDDCVMSMKDVSAARRGDFKLVRGSVRRIAEKYQIHPRHVTRLWARAIKNYQDPSVGFFQAGLSRKKGRSGRPKKWDRAALRNDLAALPISQRSSLDVLANNLKIPRSTLGMILKNEKDTILPPNDEK